MDCEALLRDVEAYIASLDADGWKESIQESIRFVELSGVLRKDNYFSGFFLISLQNIR